MNATFGFRPDRARIAGDLSRRLTLTCRRKEREGRNAACRGMVRLWGNAMVRSFLTRTGVADYLGRLWKPDVEEAVKPVRKDVRLLLNQVEELKASLERTERLASSADRTAAQVKLTVVLNREQHHRVARVSELLDATRVGNHVRAAVESA